MKRRQLIPWLTFPSRCACCDEVVGREERICKACQDLVERPDKLCTECGCEKKYCSCRFNAFHFKGCVGPFAKNDYSMQAIRHLKNDDNKEIAVFLVEEMMLVINKYYSDIHFDGVYAVPMLWTKKFFKGYNQSELLAREIAKRLNVEYVNNLYKKRKTKVQHLLERTKRFENVKDAYGYRKTVNSKNVLLIDDIKSTGATLDECARQLMFAGAENVYCATAVLNYSKSCKIKKK